MQWKLSPGSQHSGGSLVRCTLRAWAVDLDGRFVWASGQCCERLGPSAAQLAGCSIFEVWQHWPTVLTEIRDILSERKSESSVTIVRDDMLFRVWCAAIRDAQNRIAGVHGIAIDIGEQAVGERTLSESAAHWRSLVENAPEFIFTCDRQGRLLFVNHTMAGARMEDVIGVNILHFAPSEDAAKIRARVGARFCHRRIGHLRRANGMAASMKPAAGSRITSARCGKTAR